MQTMESERCAALQVLELEAGATKEEIKAAYRTLVKVWHPDRFPGDPKLQAVADNKLKAINGAYSLLSSMGFNGAPRQRASGPSAWPGKEQANAYAPPPAEEDKEPEDEQASPDPRWNYSERNEAGTNWAGRDINAAQERRPVVIIFFVLLAIAASVIYIATRQPNHTMPVIEPSQDQILGSPESAPQAGSGEPSAQTPSANAEATNPSSVGDIGGPVQVADASGDFDPLLALGALFGPVNREAQTATWLQPPKPPQGFPGLSFNTATDRLAVRVVSTLSATEGGAEKRYLITATYPTDKDYQCHACSTIIGAAEFRQDDSHWELEAFSPYVCRGPEFGADPDVTLVKIGPDRYGVSLTSSHSDMAGESESVRIVATVGNWIGDVLFQSTSYAGTNNARNYSWSNRTSIQTVPGRNPDYFDIQMVTTGTKPSADYSSVVSADQSRLFTLVDHSYR